MKLKRMLSFLLAAMLAISALPTTAFAAGGLPIDNSASNDSEWAGSKGEDLTYVELDGDYLVLAADPNNMPVDVPLGNAVIKGAYRYDVVTLAAGTYEVSFDVRLDPDSPDATNMQLGLGGLDGVTSTYSLFNVGKVTTANVSSVTVDGAKAKAGQTLPVAEDWQTFKVKFTSNGEYILKFIFNQKTARVNLKNLSVVNSATGKEVIAGADYKFDKSADTAYGGKPGISILETDYTTTKGSGAEALKYIGDDTTVYDPGVYTFTLKARAHADTTLTASIHGESDDVKLTAKTWTVAKFDFDVRSKFTMADVLVSLGGADIDFLDFAISGTPYATSENWSGVNDEAIFYNDTGDEYIQLRSITDIKTITAAVYTAQFKIVDLPAGKYKFTADVRNTATDSTNIKNGFFAGINGWYSGNSIFNPTKANASTSVSVSSAKLDGNDVDHQFPILTSDWQTYESVFTIDATKTLYIAVRAYAGFDYTSADLKNLSIINTATGEEFSANGSYSITSTTDSGAVGGIAEKVMSYYSTSGTGIDAIKYIGNNTTVYAPGTYTLTGSVCAFADTTLTASVKGVTSKVTIEADKWSTVTFEFDVRSSFTMADITVDLGGADIGFTEFLFDGIAHKFNNGWIASNGEGLIDVTVDEEYLFLMADSANMPVDIETSGGTIKGAYRYDVVTLAAGTYEVSFDVRLDKNSPASTQIQLILGGLDDVTSAYSLFNIGKVTTAEVSSVTIDGIPAKVSYVLPVSDDWQTFKVNFTSNGEYKLKFAFNEKTSVVNLKNLSVIDTATGKEVVDGADYKFNESADTIYGGKPGISILENNYTTTKGSGTSAIKSADTAMMFVPGIYTLNGKVRASEPTTFTFGLDSASVTGGTPNASCEVGTIWTDISLKIDLRETVNKNELLLSVENGDYFDFKDLAIIEAPHTKLEDFECDNGGIIVELHENPPFYLAQSSGSYANESAWNVQFIPDPDNSFSTGNYRLSISLRNDPSAPLAENTFAIRLGSAYSDADLCKPGQRMRGSEPTVNVKSVLIDGVAYTGTQTTHAIGEEWLNCIIDFEINSLNVANTFIPNKNGITLIIDGDAKPINYKEFKLTNLDENKEISTDNFTHSAINIVVGTYENRPGIECLIGDRYTTRDSGASAIKPIANSASDMMLEPGIYHLTGLMRAANESAELSANIGGTVLTTLSGASSVMFDNSSWREFTFVIDTSVDVSTLDLRICFTDEIEFKDISITLIERKINLFDVDPGFVIISLMLMKEQHLIDSATDYLAASVRKGALSYWDADSQSISFIKNADGDYLAVRNIKKNTDEITYSTGKILKPGSYFFSFEARTANISETTSLRVYISDFIGTVHLDNEWTRFEFQFDVFEKTPFELTICGGPVFFYTQDYDLRNLSLVNTDDFEGGYNFFRGGSFDSEEAIEQIRPYSSSTGKIVWKQDESGNGYITFTNRAVNYDGINIIPGHTLIPNSVYTISYDIRTSVPGESITVRAALGDEALTVENPSNASGIMYTITNEWRHVEHTVVSGGYKELQLIIRGGITAEDIKDFDVDNIVIVKKVIKSTNDDLYPYGNFDDKLTALIGWKAGYGTAKFTWNEGVDGDGYMTVSGRDVNHTPARITPISIDAGTKYRISYDIRATHAGEEFLVRAYANNQALQVPGESGKLETQFKITNEWRHIEVIYTAPADGTLQFDIKGGMSPDDNKDFDLNNFKIAIAD